LPFKDQQPKTIELLQSCEGRSLFGAVRIKAKSIVLFLDLEQKESDLNSSQDDLVVKAKSWLYSTERAAINIADKFGVLNGVQNEQLRKLAGFTEDSLDTGDLLPGDVIRGFSVVSSPGFGKKHYDNKLAEWERGMCMCDGSRERLDYLMDYLYLISLEAEREDDDIVLLVERPDRSASA